jgi:hypothetical protein
MNRKAYMSILALALVFLAFGFLTGCSSSSAPPPPPVIMITVSSGGGQTQTITEAFGQPLVALVTSNGSPASGVTVTFSAPATTGAASGTFANGTATDTETTGSNGEATSTAFTANSTAGAYNVTASASGATTSATFGETNAPPSVFVFYASGLEAPNTGNTQTLSYYAVAGAVAFDLSGNPFPDANGNCGEEDYNDGHGITATVNIKPASSGFSSSVLSTGQGTLALNTANPLLGAAGIETFAVQFANGAHALITQFDGSATSSGSMDLQSATSAPGNFAFIISGTDYNYQPVGYGGVFTVASKAITGIADVNDAGVFTIGTSSNLTGTATSADAYGRGTATITINTTQLDLAWYVVGSEVVRLIDYDAGGTSGFGSAAVGSAYGQGTAAGTFTNASLGTSVFGLLGDPFVGSPYAVAGSFVPAATSGSTTNGTLTGMMDVDEEGSAANGPITEANYTVGTNGYGSVNLIESQGTVEALGLYMTDPNLNLLDPNTPAPATTPTTTSGLLLDQDIAFSGGTGIVIPQTDTTQANFAGSYAAGAQDLNDASALVTTGTGEFDFVGQVPVASLALTGTAEVSDPFAFFVTSPATAAEYPAATLLGTATADPAEATNGRYFLFDSDENPLVLTPSSTVAAHNFSVAVYQASGNQLFWIDEDAMSQWFGTLEQQSESSMKAAFAKWKPAVKTQPKQKR